MSKFTGNKAVISQATGPTFTKNDPAKFDQKGKAKGKTPANGIVTEAKGPTFTENSTHIKSMNADKPAPMSKTLKDGKWFDPFKKGDGKNTSTGGSSGGVEGYPLKRSYEK